MVASPDNFPLLNELLADQQRLATPAARFAEEHAASERAGKPALEPVYRSLMPLTLPKAGEQYAFEVELDSCTGCKACVSACHSLNGLDETETWRDVGLVVGGNDRHAFQQTVTTACHHCADPACLNGCPVLAYEKDSVTGIVRHLDDQCIGCQYCILKCPYDVPKYNARLGIVRKCDMCQSRLGSGEAPACAQACPTHAIRIVTVAIPATAVTQSPPVTSAAGTNEFLRAAPDPSYTRPTTRYRSRSTQPPDLRAADSNSIRAQPAHWPLGIMLTFLPLAVGCHVLASILGWKAPAVASDAWPTTIAVLTELRNPSVPTEILLLAWVSGAAGLLASVAHLGQPLRAWRIFLGWRQSWLSREAMFFGAWFAVATLALAVPGLTSLAAVLGLLGLACSAMIYVDTHRRFWRLALTGPRLLFSTVVFAAAVAFGLGLSPTISAAVLGMAVLCKLAMELRGANATDIDDDNDLVPTPEQKSARLLRGRLRRVFGLRIASSLAVGVVAPWMIHGKLTPFGAGAFLLVLFAGELADRYLFFRAVDAPKMPGLPG
jgi:Fe-S-cluster-containing dehydrogenase component/DMSO reductase anchor subunit